MVYKIVLFLLELMQDHLSKPARYLSPGSCPLAALLASQWFLDEPSGRRSKVERGRDDKRVNWIIMDILA